MPGRLIHLRYAAICSGCTAALSPGTSAWWDAGSKSARCEVCEGAPRTLPPAPAEVRRGVAGRSARGMAERKRTRYQAGVRAAHPRIGGLLLSLADEPQDIKNWEKGAVGEEKLGAGLDGLADEGVVALHDRLRSGTTANIDHIAVAPSGVWVIDAKRYRGQVAKRDVGGWLRSDVRLYVGRRDCTKLVDAMAKQVGAVRRALGDEWADVPISPALCFIYAEWRWFAKPFELDGVLVTWPRAARRRLVQPGPYPPATVARIAAQLDRHLRPAA